MHAVSPVQNCSEIQVRPLWRNGAPPGARTAQRLCDAVLVGRAQAFGVPIERLCARTRQSAGIAFARQVAMYMAHVEFGLSYSEIGRGFGRDRTTVAHACRTVEERRDQPAVEAILAPLEQACALLRQRLGAESRA